MQRLDTEKVVVDLQSAITHLKTQTFVNRSVSALRASVWEVRSPSCPPVNFPPTSRRRCRLWRGIADDTRRRR
jgi:hypothetical protein